MKRIVGLLTAVLCVQSLIAVCQPNPKGQAYVERFRQAAINEQLRSGVPAAITLAQGILESGSGESELCQRSNNHFGIKCKTEWTGATTFHDDDAKGECFRVYNSAEESYADHSNFLLTRPHYAFLFKLDLTDYDGWAKGLKKAGYATNPQYPTLLRKIILDYNLQSYTLYALQKRQNDINEALALAARQGQPTPAFTNSPVPATEAETTVADHMETAAPTAVVNYPSGIFTINELRVVWADEGTSLLALAAQHGISYRKIFDYNELKEQDILAKGQLIYLERKKKLGANEVHQVLPTETLEDIAQQEGVQLESLRALNKLPMGAQPAPGEKLHLRSPATAQPKLARTAASQQA